MRSGGEDESIDEVFLHILDPLLLVEEIGGELGLADADDVGLAEQAGAGVEPGNTAIDYRFSVTHL